MTRSPRRADAVRAAFRFGVVGFVTLAVGGCAGSDKLTSPDETSVSSKLANLLAFNTTHPGPPPPSGASQEAPLQCPVIEVLDGTAAIRTYAGTDQSGGSLRHQFSIGDVARECSRSGDQILIKVGVEGRVLLGPAGAPGAFTVPIRIAVRRDSDQKAVAAKLYPVAAAVAPGATQSDFQLVSDPLSVPYTQAHADEDYTILVGLDDQGRAAADTKRPRKPKTGGN